MGFSDSCRRDGYCPDRHLRPQNRTSLESPRTPRYWVSDSCRPDSCRRDGYCPDPPPRPQNRTSLESPRTPRYWVSDSCRPDSCRRDGYCPDPPLDPRTDPLGNHPEPPDMKVLRVTVMATATHQQHPADTGKASTTGKI